MRKPDRAQSAHGLHGIGLIRSDVENPSESEILVPARPRPELDWPSLARLAGENKDMLAFIQAVIDSLKTGKPAGGQFDYLR
ncbi:MAG: hypothetical protein N2038_00610 [Geminicoccaceae bacterium]|nr:hypothetical protein [Geminicoccaceae bacterium]MDW8123336.1 hypothetical protein [Geminicoccaceae bacterium]